MRFAKCAQQSSTGRVDSAHALRQAVSYALEFAVPAPAQVRANRWALNVLTL